MTRALVGLAALTLVACPRPEGLPTTAAPGPLPGGGAWPDLLAGAPAVVATPADVAVIVALEDYASLPDRPGAHAVAAAWYAYFRDARGLPTHRVRLLRDAEATAPRIDRAIAAARRTRHVDTLWLIVVGHLASRDPGAYGELRLVDGTPYPLAPAVARVAHGRHPAAVVVLDGCSPDPRPGLAGTATPAPPPLTTRRMLAESARTGEARAWVGPPRAAREPSDVAIFSAGLGPGCVDALPGTRFPALAYLVLGGLRGWADADANGNVRALEVLRHVTLTLRAATLADPRPRPSLAGADLLLARRVAEPAPRFTALRPPTAPTVDLPALAAEPLAYTHDESMATLERGPFTMGCPRRDLTCERDERPAHRLRLSRFQIDRAEVTVADFQRCVDAGACAPIDPARCFVWTGDAFVRGAPLPAAMTRPDHPAVCVTWAQAEVYCDALGKHLPTEAEWERAAVGTAGRRYPWGDAPPTCARAHFDGCGEHTRPVARRPAGATPEGVHDLAGNAAEWVHDWYARREYGGLRWPNPTGPDHGLVRVVRGGSYYDPASGLRASYRYGLNPASGFSTVGFRCAR